MELLTLKNVTFAYSEHQKVLNNVSLNVDAGEFIVLCGPSGCGKTTLLRLLKKEIAPTGIFTGDIRYEGTNFEHCSARKLVEEIGFVMQNPDNQIVMDEVLQEILFALENLNYSHLEMRKRVAELVNFFGVEDLLKCKPSELSGGQKQMINLLSVLLLQPKVLLLDEPTSQLDPIAARELITLLERLNKEMGLTIILAEHRLEDLFAIADSVYMMDSGKIVHSGSSQALVEKLYEQKDEAFISYLPATCKLYMEVEKAPLVDSIPLHIKGGRKWINKQRSRQLDNEGPSYSTPPSSEPILKVKNVFFQYERTSPVILKGFSFQLYKGEYVALVGGNGSGKTTALKACIGNIKPQRGKAILYDKPAHKLKGKELYERIAYLPQNPITYFVHDTIGDEMVATVEKFQVENGQQIIHDLLTTFGIHHLRDRHPHDCSGGEIQRAALACMLIGQPEVLVIDEPTKGLDPLSKKNFADLLGQLNNKGLTIMMVTHDIEFAAENAMRCAMIFDGEITAEGTPHQLFKGNYFYTTAMNRLTRASSVTEVLTLEEAIYVCANQKTI